MEISGWFGKLRPSAVGNNVPVRKSVFLNGFLLPSVTLSLIFNCLVMVSTFLNGTT